MGKLIDITGQTFGRWTVLKHSHGKYWFCKCECGNIATVSGPCLRQGKSKSCGCLRTQKTIERSIKHNGTGTRLYRIWLDMKARCFNERRRDYKFYGGRGIAVCNEWKNDFIAFKTWAKCNGYGDNLTIDRIDVNGNYCPENCRWLTRKEQFNNRRTSVYITHNNKTLTIKQWAEELKISYDLLQKRLKRGWSFEKAIYTPK